MSSSFTSTVLIQFVVSIDHGCYRATTALMPNQITKEISVLEMAVGVTKTFMLWTFIFLFCPVCVALLTC